MYNHKEKIVITFIVVLTAFIVFSALPACADSDSKHKNIKKYSQTLKKDHGNESSGEIAAWLFFLANIPILFQIFTKTIRKQNFLSKSNQETIKYLNKTNSKYLMPAHYVLNTIGVLSAFIHFMLSSCDSSILPDISLLAVGLMVLTGISIKFKLLSSSYRNFTYKIHTSKILCSLILFILVTGHIIID